MRNEKIYTEEGVVLHRKNYSEADRILSIFTKNHGRVSVIAKGVRRLTSRKRGHLEVFSYINLQIAKGKGLDLITEAEIIDNFGEVRKNLKKVALAYYFMEVTGRVMHESEPNQEVFDLLLEHLEKLKMEKRLKKLRLDFVLRLLTILGFWPKGRALPDPDAKLEEVIERNLSSVRIGERLVE